MLVYRDKQAAEAAKEEAAKRSKRWSTLQQQAMHRRLKAAQDQIFLEKQQQQHEQLQKGGSGCVWGTSLSAGFPSVAVAGAEGEEAQGGGDMPAEEKEGGDVGGGVMIEATHWRQGSGGAAGSLSPRSTPLRQSKGGDGRGVGGVGTLERRWQLTQRREAPLMHIEARHQQAERQARELVEDALLQQGIEAYKYVEG
jgi:hypothetical protein